MSTTLTVPAPVYHRIEQNRRTSILLAMVAILLTLPFILATSFAVAEGITWQVSRQAHLNRFHQLRLSRHQTEYDDISHHLVSPRGLRSTMDSDMRADIGTASEYTPGEKGMRMEILLFLAAGLTGLWGMVVWGFVRSPASKLLAMCDARPAGNEEREAQHLLENLAMSAGLPAPRLFAIESMSLNAFAAGMTPRTAVIAVTDGLLALLDARELEGVLALELAHTGNHDTRLNVLAAFALFLRMPYLMRRKYRRSRQRPGWKPFDGRMQLGYSLLLLPVFLYVALTAPRLAAMVRSRELPVTASGIGLTTRQIAVCAGFGILVFAGMFVALVEFGGK